MPCSKKRNAAQAPRQWTEEELNAEPLDSSDFGDDDLLEPGNLQDVPIRIDDDDKENDAVYVGALANTKRKQAPTPNRTSRRQAAASDEKELSIITSSPGKSDLQDSLKRKRQVFEEEQSAEKRQSTELTAAKLRKEEEKEAHVFEDWKMSQSQRPGLGNIHGSQTYGSQRTLYGSQAVKPESKPVPIAETTPVRKQFRAPKPMADPNRLPSSKRLRDAQRMEDPQRPSRTFQRLAGGTQSSISDSSSGLSSPPSSIDDNLLDDEDDSLSLPDEAPSPIISARCPMCNAAIDETSLANLKANCRKGIPSRFQAMRFCDEHKARDAKAQWDMSRYPTIDWEKLDARLEKFDDTVEGILYGRIASTFRAELEAKAKEGQLNKQLRDADASAVARNAGYYGERGAERMAEHIMTRFMGDIRKRSTKDRLFTELGVSGFVQRILVPELALLLIRDDYGCEEERAKEILLESAEVGEVVNREEDGTAVEDLKRDMEIRNEEMFEDIDAFEEDITPNNDDEEEQMPTKGIGWGQESPKRRKSKRQAKKEVEIISID